MNDLANDDLTYKAIEQEGARQFREGGLLECRYTRGTPEYDAFERGYTQALKRSSDGGPMSLRWSPNYEPMPAPSNTVTSPSASQEMAAERYRRLSGKGD
jgi:hypothetical protein